MEGVLRVRRPHGRLPEGRSDPPDHPVVDGEEELALVGEEGVDVWLADARPAGDGGGARRLVAELGELADGGLEDLLAAVAGGAAGLGGGGGGHGPAIID